MCPPSFPESPLQTNWQQLEASEAQRKFSHVFLIKHSHVNPAASTADHFSCNKPTHLIQRAERSLKMKQGLSANGWLDQVVAHAGSSVKYNDRVIWL